MYYRIGIVHYKILGTDGVSLEINKWKRVLEEAGHKVFLLGGEIGNDALIVHPELHHKTAIAKRLYRYSFVDTDAFYDEDAYEKALLQEAARAESLLESFIQEHSIDYMIPQNIWSVGANPAVAIAMERVTKQHNLPVLAQHHDFYWERIGGVSYTCDTAKKMIETYLPPTDKAYRHVVINTHSQKQLKEKKGIDAVIIPNVFDFSQEPWKPDVYNSRFLSDTNLHEDDIIILQATRIVERKGIELAIDVVAAMNERRSELEGKILWSGKRFSKSSSIVLVLAGYSSDDETGTYVNRLTERALSKGVDIRFIADHIGHIRSTKDDKRIYSLWDAYVFADIITYPSYWEGWGNQFLEGLFAKVPMVVYEYPVFISDIAPREFNIISLGKSYTKDPKTHLIDIPSEIIEQAAASSIELLVDAQRRKDFVEHNFTLGSCHYSMEALASYLLPLLD